MLKHIIRIEAWWIRVPLLVLWLPGFLISWFAECAMHHPDKRRWLESDFWTQPLLLWFAAVTGEFVP
jgi:hypothetical protein